MAVSEYERDVIEAFRAIRQQKKARPPTLRASTLLGHPRADVACARSCCGRGRRAPRGCAGCACPQRAGARSHRHRAPPRAAVHVADLGAATSAPYVVLRAGGGCPRRVACGRNGAPSLCTPPRPHWTLSTCGRRADRFASALTCNSVLARRRQAPSLDHEERERAAAEVHTCAVAAARLGAQRRTRREFASDTNPLMITVREATVELMGSLRRCTMAQPSIHRH